MKKILLAILTVVLCGFLSVETITPINSQASSATISAKKSTNIHTKSHFSVASFFKNLRTFLQGNHSSLLLFQVALLHIPTYLGQI